MRQRTTTWSGVLLVALSWSATAAQAEIVAQRVRTDLSKAPLDESVWKAAPVVEVDMVAQPMSVPMPASTRTAVLKVQAVHDGQWLALRMRWQDDERSDGVGLTHQSDAVAVQFPGRTEEVPPVFMGGPRQPVHILHWRAANQVDEEQGKPTVHQMYPHASVDAYPFEFADSGALGDFSQEQRRMYAHGQAAGNPQSYPKTAVDELLAEGFGTSALLKERRARGRGEWSNGQWTVVIARPFKGTDNVSTLWAGKDIVAAFAVWQGGEGEVGGRKSLTMQWIPLKIKR